MGERLFQKIRVGEHMAKALLQGPHELRASIHRPWRVI
jgi:hypothetical protein